jgi:hypothetical protein
MATPLIFPPLNVLKPVAPDVWIVDGPVIRFATRMTVLRLGGELLVHSPTALLGQLQAQVAELGQVRWIVAPNRQHYSWIADWHAAFPAAEVYLAAGIAQRARLDFPHQLLPRLGGYPWDGAVETMALANSAVVEVEFFHRPSRTLVLTDLIQNVKPALPPPSGLARLLSRSRPARVWAGSMSDEMRQRFSAHQPQLREAVETMIGWNPERIVIAHGGWVASDGAAALRRSFDWLLKR